jgi:hypothetical protein
MTEEMHLIEMFQKTDDRGRRAVLDYAQSMSEDWPLNITSSISLTAGKLDDLESPTVVRSPKKVK